MLTRVPRICSRPLRVLSLQSTKLSITPRLAPLVTDVTLAIHASRGLASSRFTSTPSHKDQSSLPDGDSEHGESRKEHAVISTFDLFSVGVGPSSSHTVGPMRAARIFIVDLQNLGLLDKACTLKITLYGSLAATGKGHMTPQALLMGFEGSDPETIDTGTINSRYDAILENKSLNLGGVRRIKYDMDRDMLWRWDQVLKTHPNGMRFSVFGEEGELLATNEYFSVGGGFVVNEKTKVDENLFYKGVYKNKVDPARLSQTHGQDLPLLTIGAPGSETDSETPSSPSQSQPPYLFHNGASLLEMARKHNKTIAQLVYDNELHYLTPIEIRKKILKIWTTMDECIRTGVSSVEAELPGRLRLRRRAPMLYKRLMRGFYPALYGGTSGPAIGAPSMSPALANPIVETSGFGEDAVDAASRPSHPNRFDFDGGVNEPDDSGGFGKAATKRPVRVVGSFNHAILPMPTRKAVFPAMDFLSCYAIAVNEVNAAGGRIVTSPTNGASGVIPAVLKYIVEFISEDPEKDIATFLLTAAAIGMLFKRGSTISAAEGGCQAEVGVACSMAAAGFAACMGASPEVITQAAEIGIEHNLGLTCDPIDGLVQVPCIERNSLGAVKAVTAAQLALASDGVHSVTLDEAIEAMRLTAQDMSVKYKETSLSGLATTVRIPLTSPAC